MALDTRVSERLRVQGGLDFSGLQNALTSKRNFDANQNQLAIQNNRQAEQDIRQATIDKEVSAGRQLSQQSIQQQIGARDLAAERLQTTQSREDVVFETDQFNTQVDSNYSQIKNLIVNNQIDAAKDLAARTSNFVASSNAPEEIRAAELAGINSILLDLNTNQGKNALGLLDGALNANVSKGTDFSVSTPIKITDKNGKSSLVTQRTNRRTGEVEYITQDIDGQFAGTANLTANQKTQLSNDIEQGKADIKLDTELKLEKQSPAAKLALEEKELAIDITTAKNELQKTELINKKEIRVAEASDAILDVDELLADDKFTKGFGKLAVLTPDLAKSQEQIDARAQIDKVKALISLESREKLKGSGTITDSEQAQLEKSSTVLNEPLISDALAKKELKRIRTIFQRSIKRNKLTKKENAFKSRQLEDNAVQLTKEQVSNLSDEDLIANFANK